MTFTGCGLLASLDISWPCGVTGHFHIPQFLDSDKATRSVIIPCFADPLLSTHRDHAATQEHAFSWARAHSGLHLCSLLVLNFHFHIDLPLPRKRSQEQLTSFKKDLPARLLPIVEEAAVRLFLL